MRHLLAAALAVALIATSTLSASDPPPRDPAARGQATRLDATKGPDGPLELVVFGEPGCCCECERRCRCGKKTRIVCEMKKITKHRWKCECEDVCTLLPGKLCGLLGKGGPGAGCCDGCGDGDCCDACTQCDTPPRTGVCRTVKRLVKEAYVVEKPVYKCVVEYCCPGCSDIVDARAADQPTTAESAKGESRTPRVALLPLNGSGYGE